MNIRSQGVPLKPRYIREADDLVHPRSDGADFTVAEWGKKTEQLRDDLGIKEQDVEGFFDKAVEDYEKAQADNFPIDDEPESVVCTTKGTCNGWRRAHESVVKVVRLEAEVQRLKRELEYERKRLQNMTDARDEWKALAEKFVKEV